MPWTHSDTDTQTHIVKGRAIPALICLFLGHRWQPISLVEGKQFLDQIENVTPDWILHVRKFVKGSVCQRCGQRRYEINTDTWVKDDQA